MKKFELQYIDDVNIQVEETAGINDPQSDVNTSTYGKFKRGLEAGSIHIPNQTTANSSHTETDGDSWWGCSVDDWEADNDNANAYILKTGVAKFQDVKVKGNIERNDFHWTTFFESLDGFDYQTGVTISPTKITMATDGTSDNLQYISKLPTYNFNHLSWSYDRKLRTHIKFDNNTNQTIWIVSGYTSTSQNHIGFKILDGVLYGTVANGTSGNDTTLNCGNVSTSANGMALEIEFRAGDKATFYVDNVNKGSIDTNLPTLSAYANRFLYITIKATGAVVKTMHFSFWDIWQAV